MTTVLAQELDQATREERRRALATLLQNPLLAADGPHSADLGVVRRHAEWLRSWLAHHPGWRLQVSPETARLRKIPARLDDGTRPARDPKTGAPFSRRRYVLLCLALAALERSDRQTTLGKMADDVMDLTAADPTLAEAGLAFDLSSRDQRRDLVQVVRFLLDLAVLVRVHGDEEQFVSETGDALYDIRRPVLAAMLQVERGPSTVDAQGLGDRLEAILEEPVLDTDEARNRRLRSRLTRRLLDDPVVYLDELTGDERAYLESQWPHLTRRIHEATGLVGEVRMEGLALVDPTHSLTDLEMPSEGTDGHVTLLLAEHLAEHARERPGRPVGEAALTRHTASLIEEHAGHWRKSVREPGAERLLTRQALDRLAALNLVQHTPEGVIPRPAIARYAVGEPRIPGDDS